MTPKETVTNYWRAWTEHNLENLLSLLDPDFISRSSLSQGRPASKDMIAKGFKMFDKALPNLREEVVSITAEENRVVCEVLETATFSGPMELPMGVIAPTNRSYKLPVASFFRINSQGLILEQRTYWDTAGWAQQIGIDPKLFVPKPEPPKSVAG
jgi:steroid delta-isomerase-like uncharacterized protein